MSFQPLTRKKHANITIWGRQGTGKTVSAIMAASVLHKHSPAKIAVYDTENAFGAMVDAMESLGLAADTMHWLALQDNVKKPLSEDFMDFLAAAQKEGATMIIVDSVTDLLKVPRIQYQMRTGAAKIPLSAYSEIDFPFKKSIETLKRLQLHTIFTVREKVETITKGDKEDANAEPDVKDFEYLSDIKVHTEAAKLRGGGRNFMMEVTSRMAKGVKTYTPPTMDAWTEVLARYL